MRVFFIDDTLLLKFYSLKYLVFFSTKYLNVMRPENAVPSDATPRLSWCPFIPESDEPRELIHMIAVYFVSLEFILETSFFLNRVF